MVVIDKIKIKIQNEDVVLDIKEAIKIDPNNLQTEMIEQPSKYSYYATMLQVAQKELLDLKQVRDLYYYQLLRSARVTLEMENRRVTESKLAEAVNLDEKYQQLIDKIHQKTFEVQTLKSMVESLRERKDILIAMVSFARIEKLNLDVLENLISKRNKEGGRNAG